MKPARFLYERPSSVDEVVTRLADHGAGARILAGGQSLVPMMNFRLARPEVLVDINRLPSVRYVTAAPGELRIGALTRHADFLRGAEGPWRDVSGPLGDALPAVATHVGHEAIRSRGTFCGSVAHADPASEWATVALGLDAVMMTVSRAGERRIAARDFFRAAFSTALEPEEMLREVRLPLLPGGSGVGFREVSRRSRDFALAMAFVVATVDPDRRITAARISLGGVGDVPVRARAAEGLLQGAPADAASTLDDAARVAAEGLQPPSDTHASGEYRRQVVPVLVRRALDDALGRSRRNGSS